ncbi:MAG: efflux RND transporter permease subunit [Acidobacteria bacterium]|nr:efflux RND transporter permease subunit [Acidobacteriota bacterium]
MNLPEFSIHRPVTVLMASLIAVMLGAISFVEIPVDLMPEVVYPTISVRAEYPGVAPEEMETLVVRPLEEAFSAAPGVEEISSMVSEGRVYVSVRFEYGANMDEAANEMRTRLDRRRSYLPEDMEPPTMYKYDSAQYPILYLTVSATDMDAKQLRHFVEKQLQYRMERAPGVAAFSIRGGLRREIHVDLDLKKLRALDLSIASVVQIVGRENVNRPVGPMDEGRFEVLLRTKGEYENLDQIRDVVVATRGGVPVYLRDLATVEDSHEEETYMVSVDGNPAVRMYVYKQSGANTVEVSDALWSEVDRIHKDYPNISIEKTRDSADFIKASIANVESATLQGAGLAVLVLLFFLRSFSATMIIGVAIPISVISTFALMYFNGFTLNTVSFGGLALGVGMLVDNAIVVLENIYRHREEGKDRFRAALDGSGEVATAITASTLTTIAVFVPVLFIGGMSAETFKQLAYVVSFALLCSLIVALTVAPAMCSRFLRGKSADASDGAQGWLGRQYASVIEWSLAHRLLVVGFSGALFVAAIYLAPLIGVELQPEVDEGEIRVNVELEPGTRVEITDALMNRLQRLTRESFPEIQTIMLTSGGGSSGRDGNGGHLGEMRIQLKDRTERERTAAEIATTLRPMLQIEPGMMVKTRISSGMFSRRGGDDGSDRLSIQIRGHELEAGMEYAKKVRDAMGRIPGVAEAQISQRPGMPEMLVLVDRPRAASMGLNVSEIADALETAIGGRRTSMFREGGDEYSILVRLREQDRLALNQIGAVPLSTPVGRTVPAESVVQLKRQEGPTYIQRIDQQRILTVTGSLDDRDLGSVVADMETALRAIPRPDGFDIIFGGEYEEQQEAFRELAFASLLALALVYMVMASQFESLRDPLIILFSVPLAAIGVVLMLLLTETTFNMQAFLGVIVLVGVVVNNAIVLVDYMNLLRRDHHMELREAVVTAGARRLRPILMTTITTVLGLAPMALGLGEGSELQAPLARTVIGGLATSTLITLVFIPVVYYTLEGWKRRPLAAPAGEALDVPAPSGD